MRHTLTFSEADFERLHSAVFSLEGHEGAAYLLCGRSTTAGEMRFLVREVLPVLPADYLVREPYRLSIDSASYARVAKRARRRQDSVIFVHSHPGGVAEFSPQDDREEPKLLDFLTAQVPGVPHGSLVVNERPDATARVRTNGGWVRMDAVRVLGRRFTFLGGAGAVPFPRFFDRQVLAFGPQIQALLARLHVGVVGAGGTGSAVFEQLVRLGVGKVSIFEGDTLEDTNVTRVYGSTMEQCGNLKAEVAASHGRRIGVGTKIEVIPRHITYVSAARRLRDCDVVFGCTDKQTPRGILNQLAVRYLIPVIDVGVVIDSVEGIIRGIFGRVTTVLAGEACLLCRGRLDPRRIMLEALSPEARAALVREGYAPELDTPNPAVIAFTTAVAAQAIAELLHRLTGFMGPERRTTEVVFRFHETAIGKNREPAKLDCVCASEDARAAGDGDDFLGLTWPIEP